MTMLLKNFVDTWYRLDRMPAKTTTQAAKNIATAFYKLLSTSSAGGQVAIVPDSWIQPIPQNNLIKNIEKAMRKKTLEPLANALGAAILIYLNDCGPNTLYPDSHPATSISAAYGLYPYLKTYVVGNIKDAYKGKERFGKGLLEWLKTEVTVNYPDPPGGMGPLLLI